MFVNSKSLSSLKIDDTPVDDPSLKVLVANNSDTLKLLKMSSCPHVSPAGKLPWFGGFFVGWVWLLDFSLVLFVNLFFFNVCMEFCLKPVNL